MDQQAKEQIAQEKYGKSYEELSSNEKQSVGGVYGGNKRKEEMANEHGGDVHAAYQEMGSTRHPGGSEQETGQQQEEEEQQQ